MHIPADLLNEHYQDRYFDVVNAVEEARHIYFNGNDILSRLTSIGPPRRFNVGELGFGAGRVLASLICYLERCGIGDVHIRYSSVELHPVDLGKMRSLLSGFRGQLGSIIDDVADAYAGLRIDEPGWQRFSMNCQFGTIEVELWIGEALEMVRALDAPCDAWFLDGHGPKKNPQMWRSELLSAVGERTVSGGTVATYSVAGHVRRDLASAGFIVEKVPGFGGKNSVLRGVKKGCAAV